MGVPAIVVEPTGKVEGDGANADIYANDEDGTAARRHVAAHQTPLRGPGSLGT